MTAPIKTIKIERVEYQGKYACDVLVIRRDGSEENHATRLYSGAEQAWKEAQRIKAGLK